MPEIFKNNAFADDQWTVLANDDPLPKTGSVFVSLARFSSKRDALIQRHEPVGVHLEAGEQIEAIVEDLPHIAAFRLDFPAFTDGRSYSVARLLRERHGFTGEVRAAGDVLIDQIPLMLRCGFDTFEVSNEPTRTALKRGELPDVSLYMQPTSDQNEANPGTRPWLRQRNA